MEAERVYTKQPSRTIQQKRGGEGALEMVDNRPAGILQVMSDNKFIIQKQTKIVNSETDYFYDDVFYNKNELVGTRVDILLDPSDPKKGSEPGTDLNNTMYAINEHWKTSWIKGHLINHHLGGPGVAANLYPISRSANLYHCNYVENAVLNALGSLNSGEGILYSVEVTEAAHTVSNPKCKFTCEAYKTDENNTTGKYEPIFKGIDVISEPDSKPRPTFSGGFDMWGASWNISPSDQLSSQKRLFSGWKYVGNGQNSWNNGF